MKLRSIVVSALVAAGCATAKPAPTAATAPTGSAPPALDGLGAHARAVSHASPEAQRWFDQGLNLVYAFNHDESLRAFGWAASLAPGCAMCFWGVAYANGPHINNPEVPPDHASAAVAAIKQAQAAAHAAPPVEQALIAALAVRYADPQPKDRAPLDAAYAEAMRGVWKQFPRDADVGALTAEALMDLHPWDLYRPDGAPQPWTAEILAVLEAGLAVDARHPMLNHLYIHALEGSRDPARAAHAADLLRELQPGLGHMVHMPSHIDVRTGHWERAIEANHRAIAADAAYRAKVPRQGFYSLYMAHNHQMLAYAAMMSGRSAEALTAIRATVDGIPAEFRQQAAPLVDAFYALPLEVLMRFGKWDEILAAPDFGDDLPAARALRHAARGVAYAAKGELAHARDEQALFLAARAKVPAAWQMGQNPVSSLNDVAEHLLAGEILYRDHHADEGLAELRKAVAAEDALRYDEPPDWLQPTRHALGAALLQSHRYAEAEAVYREDLARIPENGWSLYGLGRALRLQSKDAEAAAVEKRFADVWSKGDVTLRSSCLCQPGV